MKKQDNRMVWVRHASVSVEELTVERVVEFVSEKEIHGFLKYKNITCNYSARSSTHPVLHHYILKLKVKDDKVTPYESYLARSKQATSKGYYSKGSEDELVNLFALFFECRMWIIRKSRDYNDLTIQILENFVYKKVNNKFFYRMFTSSLQQWNDIPNFLGQVESLDESWHYPVYRSSYLFNLALQKIGEDNDMPYVHLVSSIEVLSKFQELPEGKEEESILKKEIQSLKQRPELIEELESYISLRKSLKKFKLFVESHIGKIRPYKKEVNKGMELSVISQEEIPNYLKVLYTARSKYLHEGEPVFVEFLRNMEEIDTDISPILGGTTDNRSFERKDLIPNYSFYIEICRESIINFILAK